MKTKNKIACPDYVKIKSESCRIDCTVVEADFYTNYPNRYRIDTIANDINRYLNYSYGGRI